MSISNLNKVNKVDWGFNTEGMSFKKCADMKLDTVYPIKGCFITPDKGFGEGAVVILEDCLLNIPNRYVSQIKYVMADASIVEQIKAGQAGIKVLTFMSKYNKIGYNIEFLDL